MRRNFLCLLLVVITSIAINAESISKNDKWKQNVVSNSYVPLCYNNPVCFDNISKKTTAPVVSIAKFYAGKHAAISLTFDDGLAEHYTIAAPELEKRGLRGTFGICGSKINEDAEHITDTTRMTWSQLKEMGIRGHEISNHGWAHKNHGRFPIDVIRRDIQHNDTVIYQKTGFFPRTFFYPNNTKLKDGMAIAEAGRVGTRTFQNSIGGKHRGEYIDKWVSELIADEKWGVSMTHGITSGYDCFGRTSYFQHFLDVVKSHEDPLWCGTLHDVFAYTKEAAATTLSTVLGKNTMTVTSECSLDSALYNHPLTLIVHGITPQKAVIARQGKRSLKVTKKDGDYLVDIEPFGGTIEIKY